MNICTDPTCWFLKVQDKGIPESMVCGIVVFIRPLRPLHSSGPDDRSLRKVAHIFSCRGVYKTKKRLVS